MVRCAAVDALAFGWPVAAGSGHSRLLVGYRSDPAAPGGGVMPTLDSALDSALAAFAEGTAANGRGESYELFVVTVAADSVHA